MGDEAARVFRFGINGLAATALHYAILVALVEGAEFGPVGLATGFASVAGIAVSYFGNHRFVMRTNIAHRTAAPRFLVCYAVGISLHGGLMLLWADWAGLNYSLGFVLFTAISATVNYLLIRLYVFRDRPAG